MLNRFVNRLESPADVVLVEHRQSARHVLAELAIAPRGRVEELRNRRWPVRARGQKQVQSRPVVDEADSTRSIHQGEAHEIHRGFSLRPARVIIAHPSRFKTMTAHSSRRLSDTWRGRV